MTRTDQLSNHPTDSFEQFYPKIFYLLLAVAGMGVLYVAISSSLKSGSLLRDASFYITLVGLVAGARWISPKHATQFGRWQIRGTVRHFISNFVLLVIAFSLYPLCLFTWYHHWGAWFSTRAEFAGMICLLLACSVLMTWHQRKMRPRDN